MESKNSENWLGLKFTESIDDMEYGKAYKEEIIKYIEYLKEEALKKLDKEILSRWPMERFENIIMPLGEKTPEMKQKEKEAADKRRGYALNYFETEYNGIDYEYRYEFQKGKYKNGNIALKSVFINNKNGEIISERVLTEQVDIKLEDYQAYINESTVSQKIRSELYLRGAKYILGHYLLKRNEFNDNLEEVRLFHFTKEFLDSLESFDEVICVESWEIVQGKKFKPELSGSEYFDDLSRRMQSRMEELESLEEYAKAKSQYQKTIERGGTLVFTGGNKIRYW